MVRLALTDQLLPRSLLPFLHDCLHSSPPRYYREFEIIYRAVDNWTELSESARRACKEIRTMRCEIEESLSQTQGCCSALWGFVRDYCLVKCRMQPLIEAYYLMLVRWFLLPDVRDKYLAEQMSPGDAGAAPASVSLAQVELEDLPPLPYPLLPAERSHLAAFGIRLPPPSPDLLPPYPIIRPAYARRCYILAGVFS
ncbi:hypothetical protein JCM6882_003670 [Rhodosporidiobolus microsporus]